jgi:hypothetical protein
MGRNRPPPTFDGHFGPEDYGRVPSRAALPKGSCRAALHPPHPGSGPEQALHPGLRHVNRPGQTLKGVGGGSSTKGKFVKESYRLFP